MIKVISLFLIAIAVLAMLGRLRLPRRPRIARRSAICTCGRPRQGKAPCECGKA